MTRTAAALDASSIARRLEAAGVDVLRCSAVDVEHRHEPTPADPWRVVSTVGAVSVVLSRGGLEPIDTAAAARVAVAVLAAAGLTAERTADAWPILRVTRPAAVDAVDLDDEPVPALEPAPLVVVPCGRAKLTHAAPAGELYTGSVHRLARQAADAIAARIGGRVVILSALHGLLDLAAIVEPYDVTIGDPGAVEPAQIAAQLAELAASRVVALTPNAYTAAALEAAELAGLPLVAPLAGSRGLLEQRGRLAALRDGRADVDAAPAQLPGEIVRNARVAMVRDPDGRVRAVELCTPPAPPVDWRETREPILPAGTLPDVVPMNDRTGLARDAAGTLWPQHLEPPAAPLVLF